MLCFVFHINQKLDPYVSKDQAGIEKHSKWNGECYCGILTCILASKEENNASLELSSMGKLLYSEIK